jgi:hypothetical protein
MSMYSGFSGTLTRIGQLYSHKLIALMRVDAGSCGKGDGCVAGTDVESVVDEEVEDTSIDEVLDVPGGGCWKKCPATQ